MLQFFLVAVPRPRLLALALTVAAVWTAAAPAVAAVQLAVESHCPCPLHRPPAQTSLTAQCECHELPAGRDVVPNAATPPSIDAGATVAPPVGQSLPPLATWSQSGLVLASVSSGPDPPTYLLNLSIRR